MKDNIDEKNIDWNNTGLINEKITVNNYDMFYVQFTLKDGTKQIIRVFTDRGFPDLESEQFSVWRNKYGNEFWNKFFIKRLIGKNGLIEKENRDDYIYLGQAYNENGKLNISRFYRGDNGKTNQEIFDAQLSDIKNKVTMIENANKIQSSDNKQSTTNVSNGQKKDIIEGLREVLKKFPKGKIIKTENNGVFRIASDIMKFGDTYAVYADYIKDNKTGSPVVIIKIDNRVGLIIRDQKLISGMGFTTKERKAIYGHELGHVFSPNQQGPKDGIRKIENEVDSDTFSVEYCGNSPEIMKTALQKTDEYLLRTTPNVTQERLDRFNKEMQARYENLERLIQKQKSQQNTDIKKTLTLHQFIPNITTQDNIDTSDIIQPKKYKKSKANITEQTKEDKVIKTSDIIKKINNLTPENRKTAMMMLDSLEKNQTRGK